MGLSDSFRLLYDTINIVIVFYEVSIKVIAKLFANSLSRAIGLILAQRVLYNLRLGGRRYTYVIFGHF
jgi:hypothetical protein